MNIETKNIEIPYYKTLEEVYPFDLKYYHAYLNWALNGVKTDIPLNRKRQ